MTKIRIGTRNSQLALWQAEMVAGQLQAEGFDTELVPMSTKGDRILDRTLSKIGSKGVFTEELETGLLEGSLDIAVHSAKDMPSSLPEGLELIAFSERETVNDVVVSHNQEIDLSQPCTVATSSTRRVAMLRHFYPHLTIVDMRGNLQTRFRKMEEGHCDAMLLAFAGVHRMGMDEHIVQKLDINEFTPPTGQGSVTIEACPAQLEDQVLNRIRKACNHESSAIAVEAERAYLARMNGGCSIPTFAHAEVTEGELFFQAGIISLDGKTLVRKSAKGLVAQGAILATQVAEEVLANGGKEILEDIQAASS